MKRLVMIILIFVSSIRLFSQDVIYLKNGAEMKTRVLEIDEKSIKYKLFDRLDDSIKTIPVNDVYMIIYPNGTVEKFNNTESTGKVQDPTDNKGNSDLKKINNIEATEKSRISTYSNGVYQNIIEGIKVSQTGYKLFFYVYDKGHHGFSFDLYDLTTNKFTHLKNNVTFQSSGFLEACFGFSGNETQCFTLLDENYLQVFNIESGNELYHFKGKKKFRDLKISLPGISFNPEANKIEPDRSYLIVGKDNLVKNLINEKDFFNFFSTGIPDYTLKISKNADVVEFSPSGSLIASNNGIFPKKLFICEVKTGNLVANLDEAPSALIYTKMRFSQDEKNLIAISGRGIFIWEVFTGKFVKELQVHEKSVFDFDISKDNILVTSGADETLNFWDINNDYKKIISINPTKNNGKPVSCSYVNFSSDGTKLYAVTFSNELIVWNLNIH